LPSSGPREILSPIIMTGIALNDVLQAGALVLGVVLLFFVVGGGLFWR